MDKLRDIKGLMIIDEYSLYIFILLIVSSLVLIYLIMKFLVKFLRKDTPIKVAKKRLKSLNLNDAKQSAYTVTKYAPWLVEKEDFSYLEKYKYKKESLEFIKEDRENLERFLKDV